MLTKNVAVTVKATAADDAALIEGQFTALASVFNNTDSVGDVVMPGAFADDLKRWADSGDVIPVYWSHRMEDPHMNIGSVVEATETDTGLLVKAQLDLENPTGAQVYRLLKGRRVSRMSFAYDVLDGAPAERDGQSVYELRKLKLHEVSVVQVPANDEAAVTDVKRTPNFTTLRPPKRFGAKVATADAQLAALLVQADQAIDDALATVTAADAALDEVFDYLGLTDTDPDEVAEDAGKATRTTATKAGRVLSAKNEKALRGALDKLLAGADDLKGVLAALDDSNDGKASPTQPAITEEPSKAKVNEPARSCPASLRLRTGLDVLAAEFPSLTN